MISATAAAQPQRLKVGDATLAIDVPEKLEDLTLVLERSGKPVWTQKGWKAIAGGKPVPGTLSGVCDELGVDIVAQRLGKRASARIDVACRNGEDMFTANGVAIVIETLEPYKVLWVGDGGSVSNENDACVTERQVTFELVGKSLVEKAVETSFTNADGSCDPGRKRGKVKTTRSKGRVVVPGA